MTSLVQRLFLVAAILFLAASGGTALAAASQSPVPKAENGLDDARSEMERAQQALQEAAEKLAHLYSGQYAPSVMRWLGDGNHARRAMLGVSISDQGSQRKGVVVEAVTPGGPASAAGLKNGDIITAIDRVDLAGTKAHRASRKLVEYLANLDPGTVVTLHFLRDGKSHRAKVTTEALGDHFNGFAFSTGRGPFKRFPGGGRQWAFKLHGSPFGDMELVKLSEELGAYFGTTDGLLVVHIARDNTLALRDGDVILRIGNRVPRNQRQAMRILDSYEADEPIEVDILRHKKRQTLKTEPAKKNTGDVASVARRSP